MDLATQAFLVRPMEISAQEYKEHQMCNFFRCGVDGDGCFIKSIGWSVATVHYTVYKAWSKINCSSQFFAEYIRDK